MNRIPIVIADGAMASQLEHLGFKMPNGTPNLWSSSSLISDIELVQRVHRGYLDAGASVFSTCTYQLTLEATQSEDVTRNLFEKAIDSLDEVVTTAGHSGCRKLLSLGPCAVVQPSGTEYSGIYSHPFTHDGKPSFEAMYKFHLSRMELVPEEDWPKLDGVLFETIPLLSEVTAIRKAIKQFQQKHQAIKKEFYISMVFPDGHLPGQGIKGNNSTGAMTTMDEGYAVVRAVLMPSDGQADISGIVRRDRSFSGDAVPILLLFPDGGEIWDGGRFIGGLNVGEWCEHVEGALECASKGCWGSIWVGGCCNTSPSHIQMLHNIVSELNGP
ncbi:AdoMet-homocysteine methyltransferase [Serendipita sp. 407]|nr:AdoMet-homocysteine methyltransferase [Serendipita sp. 407]